MCELRVALNPPAHNAQAAELACLQQRRRGPWEHGAHTAVRASLGLGLGLGIVKGVGLGMRKVRALAWAS